MSILRMTDDDVRKVVADVLQREAGSAGFRGVAVVSDYDLDGEPILRINARYARRPGGKPDPLIGSIHAVRAELIRLGDDRSILLTNEVESERLEEKMAVEEDVG